MDTIAALEAEAARMGPDDPDRAACLWRLAWAYRETGRTDEAEAALLKALAIQEKSPGPESERFGDSLQFLGELNLEKGRTVQAEPLFRRALSIREIVGASPADLAATHGALGVCCMAQQRYAEAAGHYREVLAFSERIQDPDEAALEGLADALSGQGLYDEAEPHLLRARAIREKKKGADHPDLIESLARLGVLRHNQGRYPEAEELYKKVIELAERAHGPDHSELAPHLNALGLLYRDQGRFDEAQPLLDRARRLSGR